MCVLQYNTHTSDILGIFFQAPPPAPVAPCAAPIPTPHASTAASSPRSVGSNRVRQRRRPLKPQMRLPATGVDSMWRMVTRSPKFAERQWVLGPSFWILLALVRGRTGG